MLQGKALGETNKNLLNDIILNNDGYFNRNSHVVCIDSEHCFDIKKLSLVHRDKFLNNKAVASSAKHIVYKSSSIYKLFINVIHSCNMQCDYCYASNGNYQRDSVVINKDVIVEVAKNIQLLKINHIHINFFGGEPLLVPKLIDVCIKQFKTFNKDKTFSFSIVTNCSICNDSIINLIEREKISITASIDGTPENNKIHRKIKNGDNELIYGNLVRFLKASTNLSVRLVYTKKNYRLFDNVKYLSELGVKIISFRPVYSKDNDLRISLSFKEGLIAEIAKTIRWYFKKILAGDYIMLTPFNSILDVILYKKRKVNFCDFGQAITVTPEGEYYPCSHFVYDNKFKLGSVSDFDNVICNSNKIIKCITDKESLCNHCNIFDFCGGGCKAASYLFNKDISSNDDLCKLRRTIIVLVLKELSRIYVNGLQKQFEKRYIANNPMFQQKKGELHGERFS